LPLAEVIDRMVSLALTGKNDEERRLSSSSTRLVPGIRWDAKYATWDNFTGKPVDGYLANRIVGTRALCAALEESAQKGRIPRLRPAALGRLPPATRRGLLLRWSQQPEDGRTKPRHYPNIDRAEMFEKDMWPPSRATAGAAPST
jgi:D-alanyl-D-alanine dipeptidase